MTFSWPLRVSLVFVDTSTDPPTNTLYALNNSQNGWYVQDDGTGLSPLHRITERGPQQHGETDLGFRLDPRTITLLMQVQGRNEYEYQQHRARLMALWTPRQMQTALRWDLQDGSTRQIDGVAVGGLSLSRNVLDQRLALGGLGQTEALEFFCPDPTFYDPLRRMTNFGIGAISTGMQVPTPVPTPIGFTLNQTTTVTYTGTWRTYPEIRIYGPITNPVITNTTTGEVLDFTGTTIDADDIWFIDLRYGQKTIVDLAGTNQIAALSDDSDLATWHLKAIDTDLDGQDNIIRVTGINGSTATTVQIAYYVRYIGI